MSTVDDDVKIWEAARLVSLQKPEFSSRDVLDSVQKLFNEDAKKMERFLTEHCVANTSGAGGKQHNYLFKLAANRYRMFRSGDPIEFTHASAPTSPEVHRVPQEYRALFTASKFPEGLRPIAAPAAPPAAAHGDGRPEKAKHDASAGKTASQAVMQAPAQRAPPATKGLKVDMAELDATVPANIARRTIFDLLFLEFGKIGSRLETKQGDLKGESFAIQHEKVSGTVKTHQNFTIVMPSGGLVAHQSDILIELESPSRTLFIDIVEASARPDDMKAHGFDALHLKKDKKQRYSTLVFLRTPHGMLQEQAESISYGYDFFFGADANEAKNNNKFYALKSHIVDWLNGKVKTGERGA
jgi:hypothetical protein